MALSTDFDIAAETTFFLSNFLYYWANDLLNFPLNYALTQAMIGLPNDGMKLFDGTP